MKERCFLAFMLVFLLLATYIAELVTPVVASSDFIRVPEDYSAIQEAIDAAFSGDTIVVQEGLYAEGRIYVYKPLTLIAEGRVIVDGLNTAMGVLFVTSNNVVIKGFIVKNARYAGIFLFYVDNCRIEANTVANVNGSGIYVGGRNNVVKGNKVLNNVHGILLNGMFFPTSHNVVEENIAENNSWAIDLIHSDHNVVRNNMINHNLNASIIFSFSDYNSIKENRVTNTGQVGIVLLASHCNIVKENIVTNNGVGIGLSGSGWNTVEENQVKGNALYGIALYWSYACNTIRKNKVLRNGEFDLYWDQIGYTTWIENKYETKNW